MSTQDVSSLSARVQQEFPSEQEVGDFTRDHFLVQCTRNFFAHNDTTIRRCCSDPTLTCNLKLGRRSFHSEPICQLHNTPPDVMASQTSLSDVGAGQNFVETESDISFSELFRQQISPESHSHRDPVVVFWERSDRQKNIENDIIVKFSLPRGEVFTQSFSKTSTVEEMKKVVGEMFKVPFNVLQLDQGSISLHDELCICDVAIERFGSVTLQLSSLYPDRFPLILNNVYPDIPTNDVLTVIVREGERVKEIIVEIENRAILKPFLGGYRHKVTKLEYHHAFSQTAPKPSKVNIVSRNTQTPGPCKVVETAKNMLTQTSHFSSERDYKNVIIGDPARRMNHTVSYSESFEEKVVLIQRNLRSWLVRKMMLKMRDEYRRCLEWEKLQKAKVEEEKESRRMEREKAQTKPESRGHFEILYHNLEEWRRLETDRINNLGSIALRKSEAFTLLEMEIQYINSIEKQRIQHKEEQSRREQEAIIDKTAAPIKWQGAGGHVLSLDSLGTQRARNFKTLYEQLKSTAVSSEERLNILHEVKKIVSDHENGLVPELVSLLDREHRILLRDKWPNNVHSLRDRIKYLFLQYIKDPAVNPEARKYLPQSRCQKVEMYKCISCQNVSPYYKFSLHSKANNFRKCHNCCWLHEIGGPRVDVNPIRHIMNAVRREVLKESFYTSVALIMQEQDFYHLIINIWLGHSAIGGSGNLEELRLGRWDFTQCWSPWNCILLTSAELKAHLRFSNPDQIYSLSFVRKIKQRHQMGRIYFSELAAHALRRTPDNNFMNRMTLDFKASKVLMDKMIEK